MFIPFLIAAVSAHSQFMSGLMFRDPKAFVATFATADPGAINKVIEMVNGMITTGEEEEKQAIADYNSAVEIAKNLGLELDDAEEKLIYTKGLLEISQREAIDAQSIADLKQREEQDALSAQQDAQWWLEFYQEYLEHETSRIAKERAALESVAETLEALKDNKQGRRLLAKYSAKAFLANLASQGLKVDPDAVNTVLTSIANLIEEGEAQQSAADDYHEQAKAYLEDTQDEYTAAVASHVDAVDKLTLALEDKGKNESAVDGATVVYGDAKEAKEAADAERDAKNDFMESEKARVASENKDLREVKGLLAELL